MNELLTEDIIKVLLAVVMGGLVGIEREYSSKAAGFRSIILISIGSTLFTILSLRIGGPASADRIAANIITGIGFIGAGVVFKDGLTVTGITTASSIWATAALGMAIGSGQYWTAAMGLILVLLVLSLFEYVQDFIDRIHQVRSYRISFHEGHDETSEIENQLRTLKLHFKRKRQLKYSDAIIYSVDVHGKRERIDKFNSFLLQSQKVRSFEC